jgi:hypothetical protein
MQGFLRKHAIGLLALFVAIGGTSYAAAKLTGRDFKPDSITGKQVKESTLTVTRVVARPSGDQDVVADPPPGIPNDPETAGEIYPVKPSTIQLKSPGVLEVYGDMDAALTEGCSNSTAQAFVFIDGEMTAQGFMQLPPPDIGFELPTFGILAPQVVGRGRHRVEVRVASSCTNPAGGPGAEIRSADLTLVAHQ